jgi:hypothetical protein
MKLKPGKEQYEILRHFNFMAASIVLLQNGC